MPDPKDFVVKDSGHRQTWETGARRDTQEGKGRFDLVPTSPMRRLALLYERGAVGKYGERNWEKGIPLMRYVDSGLRHFNKLQAGDTTEDHAAAICWNVFGFMWTLERIEAGLLPRFLDDRPPPDAEFMTFEQVVAMRAEVAEVEKKHIEAARLNKPGPLVDTHDHAPVPSEDTWKASHGGQIQILLEECNCGAIREIVFEPGKEKRIGPWVNKTMYSFGPTQGSNGK